jgi:TRAP-type C4-dicarboxylate transport system substrate-binding protein
MKQIKWVVAHEPLDLFLRVINRFTEEVNKKTDQIEIECLTLESYSNKYNNGELISYMDLLELMDEGEVQMAQTTAAILGAYHNTDLHAVEMPFIFRDHDHATRVFEGPIGKDLLDGISKKSNIKGLAFTYSGGFRMLPAHIEINKIDDFKDLRVRTTDCAVAEETFRAVGAIPVPMDLEEIGEAIGMETIDGGESTFPRYYALKQNESMKVVNDTAHSLFTTNILISKEFWASLDTDLQNIIQDSAMTAAQAERKESISDIDKVTEQCNKDGIKVVKLNDVETDKFKEATAYLYDKFEESFTPGLLDKIKKA